MRLDRPVRLELEQGDGVVARVHGVEPVGRRIEGERPLLAEPPAGAGSTGGEGAERRERAAGGSRELDDLVLFRIVREHVDRTRRDRRASLRNRRGRTSFTLRPGRPCRSLRASRTWRSGGTRRSGLTLRACHPLCPHLALRSRRSGRSRGPRCPVVAAARGKHAPDGPEPNDENADTPIASNTHWSLLHEGRRPRDAVSMRHGACFRVRACSARHTSLRVVVGMVSRPVNDLRIHAELNRHVVSCLGSTSERHAAHPGAATGAGGGATLAPRAARSARSTER